MRKNEAVTESDFFKDVHLEGTEAPSTAKATSNFDSVVDRSKTGDYTVTINATNEDGAVSTPIEVIVHIEAESAPVITANAEVKYNKHEQTDERRFYMIVKQKSMKLMWKLKPILQKK